MDAHELGRQVAIRRRDKRWSQTELATQARVSRTYISLIERGEATNISTAILDRLATVLGTTPEGLVGRGEESALLISPALRHFGIKAGLDFDTVDRLARIPRRGREPETVEEWETLYQAIREYLDA